MGQYTESQYDDDLTVGVDEYDDFVQTDNVDLFEFYGEEESTIAKLKTIILSIDWEITNENLSEFNSELLVLKESLPGDNINLVYAQALEKICKYIYKEKANSNHNAIKLLQSFFYTLEKNLTSDAVTEEEKKAVLIEDVKQFERLKAQISGKDTSKTSVPAEPSPPPAIPQEISSIISEESLDQTSPLLKLKALILGMDWEITEKELTELGQEVKMLEKHFKDSRPKQIFLQGIGVLGAYIKSKKSNSHPDVFKLLHSFADNLDKIVSNSYSYEDEKAILLPEVEKFNKFKAMVADTIDGESDNNQESYEEEQYENIAPAFADMDEGVSGFHEEKEAAALTTVDPSLTIDNQIDSFFGGSEPSESHTPQELDRETEEESVSETISNLLVEENSANDEPDVNEALRGVDVETDADDESGEEPLPLSESGEFAPALVGDDEPGFTGKQNTGSWESSDEANEIFEKLDGFFDDAEDATTKEENTKVALQGVDVETEADDESEEEPLPLSESGEFEPAFSDFVDDGYTEETETDDSRLLVSAADTTDVSETLDNLFGGDDTDAVAPPAVDEFEKSEQETFAPALTEFDNDDSSDIASDIDKLFGDDENQFSFAENAEEGEFLDNEELSPALIDENIVGENDFSTGVENTLDSFFTEGEEPVATLADDPIAALADDPIAALADDPIAALADDPIAALADDPIAALADDPIATLADDPIAALADDPIATLADDPIAALADDPIAALADDPIAALADDPIAALADDPIAALADDPIAALADDPIDSVDFTPEEDVVLEKITDSSVDEDSMFVDEEDLDLFSATDEPAADISDDKNDAEDLFADFDESESSPSEYTVDPVDEEEEVIFEVIADDHDEEVLQNDGFTAVFDEVVEDDTEREEAISFEETVETTEDEKLTIEVDEQDVDLFAQPVALGIEDDDELSLSENDQEEDLEEYFKNTGLGDIQKDELSNLRVGVSSIGVELEDGILDSLAAEIRELSQKWNGKLVGKTFLQLMSTILQHINQYRYEASSDAHDMLLSIFDKIEVIHRGDMDSVEEQQILLTETSKVLQWQQIMLDRQAVKKGDTLTFMDPIRSDGAIDQKVGEFVFTEDDIVAEDDEEILFNDSLLEDREGVEDAIDPKKLEIEKNSTTVNVVSTTDNTEITNVIREEMNSLRESLQSEIESLRKELGK